MRNLSWDKNAWDDYVWWFQHDSKILKKINELIKECLRDPFKGKGKPEALKADLSGYWSRRISGEHRLVYQVTDEYIHIIQCRFHY